MNTSKSSIYDLKVFIFEELLPWNRFVQNICKSSIIAETTNGIATCSLSALSYVYAILDGSSNNTAKNAVSSLYIYYDATLNYRSKA